MSDIYLNLKNTILENKEFKINSIELLHDNLILSCNKESLVKNIDILKRDKSLKFRQLIDIAGVDYPQKIKRFEVIYLLLSHENNLRISIKI